MTVGQLKKYLEKVPDDLEVMQTTDDDEFRYAPVVAVHIKKVTFGVGQVPKKQQPKIDCLIITDVFE